MNLDTSRILKLKDSYRKIVPKKQREGNFNWNVQTRRKKGFEDKKTNLEAKIHPKPALDKNRAGRETEVKGEQYINE